MHLCYTFSCPTRHEGRSRATCLLRYPPARRNNTPDLIALSRLLLFEQNITITKQRKRGSETKTKEKMPDTK